MSADVTIFAYVWGTTHNHFIPEWHQAIQNLEHQPAEVLIATNPDNPADVYDLPYTILEYSEMATNINGTQWLNKLVGNVKTKWVAECDIDDLLYPDAFRYLPDAEGYDACANSIRFKSNGLIGCSRPERFFADPHANHVMVNAYFTKEIFDRVGGYDPLPYFHDWGFWWKLHKHNARWFPMPGVQMLYNDIPSPHKATGNFPENALPDTLQFIRTYDPTNPKD
jgi:hypothetical protein